MSTTIILAAIFLGLFVLQVSLWASFLRMGLRWARIAEVTTRRVVIANVIVFATQIVLSIFVGLSSPSTSVQVVLLNILGTSAGVLVPCFVIMRVFRSRFLRSFQAWLPTLIPAVAMILVALLVVRFIYQAFSVPTNAMAPTLVGSHWQGTCPVCGHLNYCSPIDERHGPIQSPQMICDNFHVAQSLVVDKLAHAADRFLVAKFLAPRRWDLVVFRYPEEPATLYVKRLVGFPGEEIKIEDGSVWVNGNKQAPPNSIRRIKYLSQIPNWRGPDLWGTGDRPAVLSDDEYFVLGDFSAHSKDSRLWEKGAPGHNPFAVPESHLIGVVTHVYWPPRRLRILR